MTQLNLTITEHPDHEYTLSFACDGLVQEHKCVLTVTQEQAVIATLQELIDIITGVKEHV